jgi:hypothetical protein
VQVYEENQDINDFTENLELYLYHNRERRPRSPVIKDYRLALVLEANNMSERDIDKVLSLTADLEELTQKDRVIKDAIDLYFSIEDEDELVNSLKCSGLFPSLN